MRFGLLPTMVLASIGLHVALVGGLGISWWSSHAAPTPLAAVAPPAEKTIELWIKAQETPAPIQLVQPASTPPPASTDGVPLIASTLPVPRTFHRTENAETVALKAHASAHIRQLAIDSDLCPAVAPKVDSRRGVVFIVDVSGSMYESFAGTTRLAIARQILSRQIAALPDGTPFALTFYGERAALSGPLVVASASTRAAAVKFLARDLDLGGGTSLPSGLDLAETLRPGQLIIATDGDLNTAPFRTLATGRELMQDSPRPAVTICAICPRSGTNDESTLRSLAAQQGGSYLAATLDESSGLLTFDGR